MQKPAGTNSLRVLILLFDFLPRCRIGLQSRMPHNPKPRIARQRVLTYSIQRKSMKPGTSFSQSASQ